MKIAVVDYGMGNLRSVSKAIEHVAPEARVLVTADPVELRSADRVVVGYKGSPAFRTIRTGNAAATIARLERSPRVRYAVPDVVAHATDTAWAEGDETMEVEDLWRSSTPEIRDLARAADSGGRMGE